MLVYFYTFAKKDNSTALPTGSAVFAPNCVLKDDCSVLHPVIKIANGDGWNPSLYNYCQISDFGRYYFVRDWTQDKNIWYAHCDVDPLASWRTEIGALSPYILRSSNVFNTKIRDELYPITSENVFYARQSSNLWNVAQNGTFIIGLLANSGQSTIPGGVNYYALSINDYKKFMARVFCVDSTLASVSANGDLKTGISAIFAPPGGSTSLTDDQINALAYMAENPYTDYIDSIIWFPYSVTDISDASAIQTGLYLGTNYLSDVTYRILDPKFRRSYTAVFSDIQKHPQASARGEWLNAAPYSNYQLYLPRIGLINIDSSLLINYTKLTVNVECDAITGQGLYRVYIGNADDSVKHLIYTDFVDIGVTIKIGTNKPVGTSVTAATGLLQSVTSMNPFAVASSIVSLEREQMAPGSGRIGDSGGYMGLEGKEGQYYGFVILQSTHYIVASDDNADNGRPLCQVRQISATPGYIQCQHGDVAIPATIEELRAIKNFMESGFFYE